MKRRGFLALPFVAALAHVVAKVRRRFTRPALPRRTVFAGADCEFATWQEAMRSVAPGSTIYVMPGHEESITAPVEWTGVRTIGLDS